MTDQVKAYILAALALVTLGHICFAACRKKKVKAVTCELPSNPEDYVLSVFGMSLIWPITWTMGGLVAGSKILGAYLDK